MMVTVQVTPCRFTNRPDRKKTRGLSHFLILVLYSFTDLADEFRQRGPKTANSVTIQENKLTGSEL